MHRGRVGRHRGERDDQVAERVARLEAAAGADTDQLLAAELDQLLEHDRGAGAAHARALDRDGPAVVGAGVAEQAALLVALDDIVEVGLGDVLGSERVSGEEDGFGVIARFGANVNRHGARLYRDARGFTPCHGWSNRRHEQVLEFCAREPVERVFVEEMARRAVGRFVGLEDDDGTLQALCHAGANLVPSGHGCEAFADAAVRSNSRMIIGEERAVAELWEAAGSLLPAPREDRPGQPVFVIVGATAARGQRAAAGDPGRRCHAASCVRGRPRVGARNRPAPPRRRRLPLACPQRRSTRAARGSGSRTASILFKAEASAWTPGAVQVQQVWVDPAARGQGYGAAACATSAAAARDDAGASPSSYAPTTCRRSRLYESIGMQRVLTYRSILFP